MPDNDYYKTLDVPKSATAEQIRKAYKKLARKYHPDTNPNDKSAVEKFKEVQEAFDVLGDEEKRKKYDQFGSAAFQGGGRGGGQPFNWTGPQGGGAGPVDLGDLFGGQFNFGDLFGGMGGQAGARGGRRQQKGNDIQLEVDIPFQIAAEGGSHDLHLDRDGKHERLSVKIPAGVDTGSVVRLGGQGSPGLNGGPSGDLLVMIRVAPHPWFRREGNNLLVDVPLTITEAALGAKVEVPTLTEGKVMLTIPPGTSSGAKLRLRGKGIVDRATKQRGDQHVVVKIVVPSKPGARVKQLLQELAEAEPQSPREGMW